MSDEGRGSDSRFDPRSEAPSETDEPLDHAPSVPREVVENEQIFVMLVDSVSSRVNERLDAKLARMQTAYIGGLGVLLTLIIAVGGYVGNLVLDLQVERKIAERFEAQLSRQRATAEFLPRSTALRIELMMAEDRLSLSPDFIERVIGEFDELYSTYASVGPRSTVDSREEAASYRQQLAPAFDSLAKNLGAIGNDEHLARVVSIAPELASSSDLVMQTLVQHYGRSVIGAAGGADAWVEGGINRVQYENYRKYAERARQGGWPELFLVFESIIWMMEEREESDILELIADIDSLRDRDLENYKALLASLLTESYIVNETAESERIKERTLDFVRRFRDQSGVLQDVAEQLGVSV